jgi:hypothetical protein
MKILILFLFVFCFFKGFSQTRDVGSIQDTNRTFVYVFDLKSYKFVSRSTPSNAFKTRWINNIEVRKDHRENISSSKCDSIYIYIKKRYNKRVQKFLKSQQ